MRKPDPYPMMRQFMAPAWSRPGLWRVIGVVAVFEAAFHYTPYLYQSAGSGGVDGAKVRPVDTLADFGSFIIPCLAMLLAIRLLHGRGFASLIGPKDAAWRDLKRVTLAVGLVLLAQEPLRLSLEWDHFATTRDLGLWAVMLPFGLLVLLVQVGTEELYFRGYLPQQLAVRNLSPWAWMIAPSVYFGFAHYINGVTPFDSLVWTIWASVLGLACADLTARTGNLGAAVGLHLANNIFALVVVGTQDWPGSGLALFLYPAQDINDTLIPIGPSLVELALSLISIGVMWLAARVAVRR